MKIISSFLINIRKILAENHKLRQGHENSAESFQQEYNLYKMNHSFLTQHIIDVKKPAWISGSSSQLVPNSQDILPPQELYSRIAGKNQLLGEAAKDILLESGYLDAAESIKIFELYSTKSLDSKIEVLDWGVGLSRILRHFKNTQAKLTGVDVDGVSIDFCKKNYEFANFFQIGTAEQEFFIDRKFDLIYGFSVMTHLAESDQLFYLKQLSKILDRDGVALITISGPSTVLKTDWAKDQSLLNTYFTLGQVEGAPNFDISGEVPEGYYRDVATTHKHVYEKWSEYFDILDIIPSGLGQTNGLSSQDVVVLKSRQGALPLLRRN